MTAFVLSRSKHENIHLNEYQPKVTRAGTADWLIQNETQDIATSKMEGMYDWMM